MARITKAELASIRELRKNLVREKEGLAFKNYDKDWEEFIRIHKHVTRTPPELNDKDRA